jgi:Xaa-Pro aminopeptidase
MDLAAQRRSRLVEASGDQSPDAFLVSTPVNVTYLTGFSGESSHLVLTRDRALLLSDSRFTEQIAAECPGLEAIIRPPDKPLAAAVAEVLGKLGVRTVGFESGHLTVAELETLVDLAPTLQWKSERDRVERLRAVKDATEVAAIREAIAFAERAFTVFRALLRPADREKDLCDALEGYVRKAGGWSTSFPPIVAVGERAALPHAPPTSKAVGESDLLLVDWGASGRFYKSDLTRVLATRRISPKLEEIYGVVLRAQENALLAARPGAKGSEVDAAARAIIHEAGYGNHFGHGLGHGLGLQVHEAPSVRPNSEAVLEPGNVITIEPGIYLPGWGGVRIEDDVLITPDGCEVLTSVPKNLASIVANG